MNKRFVLLVLFISLGVVGFANVKPFAVTKVSYLTVSLKKIPSQTKLFARVVPQRIYKISSALNGRVSSFSLNTGETIDKNTFIANITSNAISAKIQLLKEKTAETKQELSIAHSILNITKQEYHQQLLSTQSLLKVKMEFEKVKVSLKLLRIQLKFLLAQGKLYSFANGKVLNIFTANGDYVKSGQTLLTILSNKNRLLVTAYKKNNSIKIGQKGWFFPQQKNAKPILMAVSTIISDPNVAGIWHIYLHPVHSNTHWVVGEVGNFEFIIKARYFIAVPKKALIMNKGKWWVVKKTDYGIRKIEVFPFTSNNKWVWLKKGALKRGEKIVISGAYQIFHEDFSKNYEDPN